MRKNLSLFCALIVVVGLAQIAPAANYTWTRLVAGPCNWADPANWSTDGTPGTYPNTAGDIVNMSIDIAGDQQVTMPASPVTIGSLSIGDISPTNLVSTNGIWLGTSPGQGTIILNNPNGNAAITETRAVGYPGASSPASRDYINANLVIQQDLYLSSAYNTSSNYVMRVRGSITESGGSFALRESGVGYMYVGGSHSNWTGGTFIGDTVTGGPLRFQMSAVDSGGPGGDWPTYPSTIMPGDITVTAGCIQNFLNDVISDNAKVTLNNPNRSWQMDGYEETIGCLAGTSPLAFIDNGGRLTLQGKSDVATADYAGGIMTTGDPNSVTLIKQGTYTQTFSGTASNNIHSCTVTGGVLAFNKTAGVNATGNALATGNTLSIGDGAGHGEVRLLASDQILDAVAVTLNGGTFNVNGQAEVVSTLALTANSTIDLLAGTATSMVTFANSSAMSWSGTLTVAGWDGATAGGGTEQLNFGAGGLTAAEIAQIQFLNPAGFAPGTYAAQLLASGEVVPVASFLPGDANQDGKVSFADYILLANNFGQTGATWAMGDFNGDGKVSFADYILLANNFGQHTPEPATLGLLLIGGLGLIRRNRK